MSFQCVKKVARVCQEVYMTPYPMCFEEIMSVYIIKHNYIWTITRAQPLWLLLIQIFAPFDAGVILIGCHHLSAGKR